MDKTSLCANCKLRVSNYCFCGNKPEKISDGITIKCDYFFFNDSDSPYFEFIDGYKHCNRLKNIDLHKTVKALNKKIRELERQLEAARNEKD